MIYAFIVGGALGYSKESLGLSAAVLLGLVTFKGVWEIAFKTQWITSTPSNYVLYLDNLKRQGDVGGRPWVSYLLLSIATGCASGAVAYALAYYLL